MFVFENHLFQPPSQPKNRRLTESSALKACYCWLPDGRSINHKNLDYEIETVMSTTRSDRSSYPRSTIRISITRLKPPRTASSASALSAINHKNLDYEIETKEHRWICRAIAKAINHKNLDYEIETSNDVGNAMADLRRSTIRISITRLKRLLVFVSVRPCRARSTIRISITRLKPFVFCARLLKEMSDQP